MNIWKKITQLLEERKNFALATIVEAKGSTPRKEGSRLIVTEDHEFFGTVGGGNLENKVIELAKQVIATKKPLLVDFNLSKDLNMACGGKVKVFIEPIEPNYQLIIFGGGHVGKALAFYAHKLDFDIVVVDPREEVLNSWDFSAENIKFVKDTFQNALNILHFDNRTFICSLAYTHDLDLYVAANCLSKPHAYLGIIASKNKARKIAKILVEQYNFSEDQVSSIDMPIGIDIKTETPEEIAISILAKIIDIKNSIENDNQSLQNSLQNIKPLNISE